jgi:diguanylate cyclase
MDSNVGLAIQCVGILLLTLLFVFMRSSIRSASLKYWTIAWAILSVSLLSLFVAFLTQPRHTLFYSIYFLGEYVFGLLFIAGCRNHITDSVLTKRHLVMLAPAAFVALILPGLSADFNDLFMVHSALMAVLFCCALVTLRVGFRGKEQTPGMRVISIALLFLTIDFLHYVPVFATRKGLFGVTVPTSYLQYTSIFDLVLEILLGFGTMMILMEGIRREVELVNGKLLEASDQLEMLAKMDPLTEALNRHAFHSLLRHPERGREAQTSGTVAVIDIDNLKPINDTLGHSAGDKAIRSVARAMRSLIRADDMLFRWGGDEFLVLMFKLPEEEARRRMNSLNKILAENCQRWTGIPMSVTVSHGVAGFESLTGMAAAIEEADKAMYEQRGLARSPRRLNEEALV